MKELLYEQYHEYVNRPVSERKPVCCFCAPGSVKETAEGKGVRREAESEGS